MELGIIGLGRMGANMTERLVLGGHRLISFDRSPEAIQRVVDKGALGAHSLADFVKQLSLKVIAALRNEFGGHAVKKG
jgi:6-phosphogluconate dehydrogenase